MELQSVINILVPISLISMMLAIGLDVAMDKVLAVARDWRLLARAAAANYLVVPGAAVGLLLLFHADPMVSIGFLILTACPGAPFGPVFTAIARGHVAVSVGLMILLAGSSAVLAPLLLYVLIPLVAAGDVHVEIDAATVLITLLITQLLPLCLGLGVRRYLPRVADSIMRPANQTSALLGLASVVLILAAQYQTLAAIRPRGWLGMLVLLVASLGAGWVFGGPGRENRSAMALTTSLRNLGVALVIANGAFAGTAVVVTVVAYGLLELAGSLMVALVPRMVSVSKPGSDLLHDGLGTPQRG